MPVAAWAQQPKQDAPKAQPPKAQPAPAKKPAKPVDPPPPADAKAGDAKAGDAKAGDAPADVKPGDVKPGDVKPGDAKVADPAAKPPTDQAAPGQPPPPAPQPKDDEPVLPPPGADKPLEPNPDRDGKQLAKQGSERPTASGEIGARPSDVYAEDWWSQARPVFEIHGYFRVRSELFNNFALGRKDLPDKALWPQPADNDYTDVQGNPHPVKQCGTDAGAKPQAACENNTQAGANMRFRIEPELHISDNLRIRSQIDLLDNLVMGSTADGYGTKGYGQAVLPRGGYTPIGAFSTTQNPPVAGYSSTTNSVSVKRVWGEYMTPVGLLRFGRMPSQWGLGMLANEGSGFDADYQSTADRLMFVTGIKKYDLYFGAAWDFANEGATNAKLLEQQGQPVDLMQSDDVDQYAFFAARRRNPELQRLDLARGNVVVNGGMYFVYRKQNLATDGIDNGPSLGVDSSTAGKGLTRRGAWAVIPDFWVQLLYRKFRFEAEGAMIYGGLENTPAGQDYFNKVDPNNSGWKIRQFGMVTQSEFRAIEDKLRIQFGFGYASGDPDTDSLVPPANGLQKQLTSNRTYSEFRFHPAYQVDMILFRNILSRVQGAYYFKPAVEYDFQRDKNGQRLGGGASLIWSRASEFVQTPGHARDLGIELNFQLYFQARDGALNDDPNKMGGFYTMLQYGVLFPLSGFNYLPGEISDYTQRTNLSSSTLDTKTAQALRWYLGILY
jgi:uncharacterized protein (TIGR04551 family)